MAQQLIGIGSAANDGTGDPLRTAFSKTKSNFAELYAQGGTVYTTNGSRWWLPGGGQIYGSGSAPGSGSIRLFPGYVGSQITINALSCRVSTTSAGGNFQIAIYAASATTSYPTGTVLVSTASISTTTGGLQSGTASLQLGPGLYWFATNCDNGTAAFNAFSTGSTAIASIVGLQGTANVFAGVSGLSVTQTFNTWPDLTATSWSSTNEVTTSTIPAVAFQIASVP